MATIRYTGTPRTGIGIWNLTVENVEFSFQGPPITATADDVRAAAIAAGGRYASARPTLSEDLACRRWLASVSGEIRSAPVVATPRRAPTAIEAFL